jgi:hypothetical protein
MTCKHANSEHPALCQQSVGKRGARGNPDSPNYSSLRTATSEDTGADGVSPTTSLWGGSELDPLEASTCITSFEDEGVGGSGWATERRKLRAPKVYFLFKKKPVEFQAQAPEVVGYREGPQHSKRTYRADGGRQPLLQTFLGKGPDSPRENKDTAATVPDDFETYWASRRTVEPISLSPVCKKASPLPCGLKSPTWGEVTETDWKATYPPLGGVLTDVR